MTEEEFRRGVLPSQKSEKKREVQEHRTRLADAQAALMREDFGKTFNTAHGKRVLAWLRARCGHNRVILSADKNSQIDPMATTFAAMELNLYLELRKYIPIETLAEIEYDRIKPSGTISPDDTDSTSTNKRRTSKS